MTRTLLLRIALAFTAAVGLVGANLALAQTPSDCRSELVNPETRDITCAIARPSGRSRLVVKLSGSHDDTSASIQVRLDTAPLTCDRESKTSLFGEDGDVFLDCRFTIADTAPRSVHARLVVRHAEYVSAALE